MAGAETTLGGSQGHFPETVWQTVLGSPERDSPERRAALERFLTPYWRPVYSFLRRSGVSSVEDAKDLTQEFFRYLLEGDVLPKYRQEKGRFRSFLKGVLRRFSSQARRDQAAQKRGGGVRILSLDAAAMEADRFLAERERLTPEEVFDRQWALAMLQESVTDLRRALPAEGKAECLKVYEAYELVPAGQAQPTYGELAKSMGVTEHQVRGHLDAARARLERIVRERLSRGVTSAQELAEEMNDLFSA